MKRSVAALAVAALAAFAAPAHAGATAAALEIRMLGGENVSETEYRLDGVGAAAGLLEDAAHLGGYACSIVGAGQLEAPADVEDSVAWSLSCTGTAGTTITADLTGDYSRPNREGNQSPVAYIQLGGIGHINGGDDHVFTCKALLQTTTLLGACVIL